MNEEVLKSIIVPSEPPTDTDPSLISTIQMRGPNGERFVRRFLKNNTTIQDLVNFYKKEVKENIKVSLVIPFPKKDLTEFSFTLE